MPNNVPVNVKNCAMTIATPASMLCSLRIMRAVNAMAIAATKDSPARPLSYVRRSAFILQEIETRGSCLEKLPRIDEWL